MMEKNIEFNENKFLTEENITISETVNKFYSKLQRIGYKEKFKLTLDNIPDSNNNIKNLFTFLSNYTVEEYTINNNEKILLNEYLEYNTNTDSNIDNDSDTDILNLEEKLIENEIQFLNEEINNIEREINKENYIFNLEINEEKKMKGKEIVYEEKIKNMNLYYEKEISQFGSNQLNNFINKLTELNKSSLNMIAELDMNIMKAVNYNKILIGFHKFDNSDIENVFNQLDCLIKIFENKLKEIEAPIANDNNTNIKEFQTLITNFDKIENMYNKFF
jgi:hypothetical protein